MNSAHCESPIRIAAAVIIDADGRLLLVRKRGTSAFMQPGGKIEPDELPIDALVRELREELGLVIDPGAPSWLGSFSAQAANEPGVVVNAELFAMSLWGEPIPAAEIEEMIWLEPGPAGAISLAPLTLETVLPMREALQQRP